eukprot:15130-Heterococcus_DN1.PRE.1
MEYLYIGAVQGVTAGRLDVDKLQAALLAAEFFHVDALAQDAQYWAALSGVEIDTTNLPRVCTACTPCRYCSCNVHQCRLAAIRAALVATTAPASIYPQQLRKQRSVGSA